MAGRTTYRDIALRSNVSPATVSRVARGSARVHPEIVARVKKAAEQLGVELSRRGRPQVLAFILSNRSMLHPFHSRILEAAEEYCTASGWTILFIRLNYSPSLTSRQIQLPPILERRDLVDAFILAGSNTENFLELLTLKNRRFVVLGTNVSGEWEQAKYNVVWLDDVQGAQEMTRYLISLGHKDIWYVGNTDLTWYARRYAGYCQAMQEAGLPPRLGKSVSDNDLDIGFLATKALLSRAEPVTAIFGGGDSAAQGVYKALREFGMRIPEDVSVAGFGDHLEVAQFHPPLTSVRVFTREIGKQMVELVMRQFEHPNQPPQHVTIPTELVKRESCRSISAAERAAGAKGSETTGQVQSASRGYGGNTVGNTETGD